MHAYAMLLCVCIVLCDFSCGMRYTCVSVREQWLVEWKCLCMILIFVACNANAKVVTVFFKIYTIYYIIQRSSSWFDSLIE